MKTAVSKERSAVRGSVGEASVRYPPPCQKLVLKQRPLARGTVGVLGVRRAMLGGEPTMPTTDIVKLHKVSAKKIAAKKMPRKTSPRALQKGEIAVSLTEDESEESPKEVSGVKCGVLDAR